MKIGKCLCGQVEFEGGGEPLWIGACHCRMCQRQCGGAFQIWAAFLTEKVKISGELRAYERRKAKNQGYSLRAFARDLGVASPKLSQYLNGECGISASSNS